MRTGWAAVAEVDWSKLFHAYGMASDTPGHLRALVGDDEAARGAAVAHLRSAVIHQGTPWTVTPPAALVVAGLLPDPRTARPVTAGDGLGDMPLRALLLGFLTEVAEAAQPGVPEEELRAAAHPQGREPDVAALAERMFALEEGDEDDEDGDSDEDWDGDSDEDWDEEVAEAAIAGAVLALRAIAPALVESVAAHLDDRDPHVRHSASRAMAALTEITAPAGSP
ncbi:hypothetical protein [Nonomuraea indica]|uniref:hypothetical protein n=1 Tax=Nonomuraea indica TaxID=1581193 RepID=UPI000C7B74A0|nr:hypothetical protein [Nonomuraea indica]